jgi:broad specificity phosphatase PhoE
LRQKFYKKKDVYGAYVEDVRENGRFNESDSDFFKRMQVLKDVLVTEIKEEKVLIVAHNFTLMGITARKARSKKRNRGLVGALKF